MYPLHLASGRFGAAVRGSTSLRQSATFHCQRGRLLLLLSSLLEHQLRLKDGVDYSTKCVKCSISSSKEVNRSTRRFRGGPVNIHLVSSRVPYSITANPSSLLSSSSSATPLAFQNAFLAAFFAFLSFFSLFVNTSTFFGVADSNMADISPSSSES